MQEKGKRGAIQVLKKQSYQITCLIKC
uniref:Uncharacterized protein n=1 Tax=Rhizophora mucronata TaxID=61149 RepID=A0A2P2N3D1_RHIMU